MYSRPTSIPRGMKKQFRQWINPDKSPGGFVHKTARVCKLVIIGRDSVVHEKCYIGENTYIGESVIIKKETRISNDVVIRSFSTIGERTTIHPNVEIGISCRIGNRTLIDTDTIIHSSSIIQNDVTLGIECVIADSSVVGVSLLSNSVTAERSIVDRYNTLSGIFDGRKWVYYRGPNNKRRLAVGCQNHSLAKWNNDIDSILRNSLVPYRRSRIVKAVAALTEFIKASNL